MTEALLDFTGIPQKIVTKHSRLKTSRPIIVAQDFEYDQQNRLLKHYHEVVGKSPKELLTENHYNELGQLEWKKVGGTDNAPLQKIDFTYNIRSWLTQINDPSNLQNNLFGYKINYNNPLEGMALPNGDYSKPVVQKRNGSIAEVLWKAQNDTDVKRYGYVYDNTNRLLAGLYQGNLTQASKEHTETVTYDQNGNINTLQRSAYFHGTAELLIDNLSYHYNGNKVSNITDASNNANGYEGGGNPISYDDNGNMTAMPDKGISKIAYNFLNLPKQMIQKGNTTNYLYRADGVKLKKEYALVNDVGTSIINTEYLDGFQYSTPNTEPLRMALNQQDDVTLSIAKAGNEETFLALEERIIINNPGEQEAMVLSFFPTAEGYYDFENLRYIYQYKDHLGNVRVSYVKNSAGELEIKDNNSYYPFGMSHLKGSSIYDPLAIPYNYKYNNKELQETGMYDYGWRQYMPDIGKWNGMDQLAENYLSHSPYAYVMNNPIMMTDPDGRQHLLTQAFQGEPDRNTNPQQYGLGSSGSSDAWNMLGHMGNDSGGGSLSFNSGFSSLLNYFNNGGSVNGITSQNGFATFWTDGGIPNAGYFLGSDGERQRDIHGLVGHNIRISSYVFAPPASNNSTDNNLFGLGLSAASFGTGVYSDYIHNHKTYTTTAGQIKNIYKGNGAVRSARASQFASNSKFIKGLGVVGAVASTAYTGYKVANQINEGGMNNINSLDLADTVVGIVGLVALSNPVGWGVVGAGVTLYFGARLAYDLYNTVSD